MLPKKKVWLPFLRFFFNKKNNYFNEETFSPSAFCTSFKIILFQTNKKIINILCCSKNSSFKEETFFKKTNPWKGKAETASFLLKAKARFRFFYQRNLLETLFYWRKSLPNWSSKKKKRKQFWTSKPDLKKKSKSSR